MEPRSHRRVFLVTWCVAAFVVVVGGGAATYVALGRMRAPANAALCRAMIGPNWTIAKALESYKTDMGQLPSTEEGLAALFHKRDEVDDDRYRGPYLDGSLESLKDPWGNPYEYRHGDVTRSDAGYELWSWGPNGVNNGGKKGSDDIKNWRDK